MSEVRLDFLAHADFSGRLRKTKKQPGYAVFATAIEKIRKKNPEGTLLLDAGDTFCTTFWPGLPLVRANSLLKTDAMTLGNHEFDFGRDFLNNCIDSADFPILCSNIIERETGRIIVGTKPYTLFERKGVQIGVLGITTEYTPYMVTEKSFSSYEIKSCVEACRHYIPEMKAAGSELVVLLAHVPFYVDEEGRTSGELIEILEKIPEVDICIGGHIPGDYAGLWKDTILLKGGFGGVSLCHASILYNKNLCKITEKDLRVLLTDQNLEPLSHYREYADSITNPFEEFFTRPLTFTNEEWVIKLSSETKLGNFLAQSVEDMAGTEIAYLNSTSSGGKINPGPVTVEDVIGIMGFNDPILKAEITGKQLYHLFELVYEPERFGNNAGLFFSGIIVHADHTKPAFSKILSITKRDGTIIEKNRIYTIATSEYMSTGGNDTGEIANYLTWTQTGLKMYDALFAYIKKHDSLYVSPEQRMYEVGRPENDNSPF